MESSSVFLFNLLTKNTPFIRGERNLVHLDYPNTGSNLNYNLYCVYCTNFSDLTLMDQIQTKQWTADSPGAAFQLFLKWFAMCKAVELYFAISVKMMVNSKQCFEGRLHKITILLRVNPSLKIIS